jgi:hypothetical protein
MQKVILVFYLSHLCAFQCRDSSVLDQSFWCVNTNNSGLTHESLWPYISSVLHRVVRCLGLGLEDGPETRLEMSGCSFQGRNLWCPLVGISSVH